MENLVNPNMRLTTELTSHLATSRESQLLPPFSRKFWISALRHSEHCGEVTLCRRNLWLPQRVRVLRAHGLAVEMMFARMCGHVRTCVVRVCFRVRRYVYQSVCGAAGIGCESYV